jgi:hypothetical protein
MAGNSEEGQGPQRAVAPMMMMMMIIIYHCRILIVHIQEIKDAAVSFGTSAFKINSSPLLLAHMSALI